MSWHLGPLCPFDLESTGLDVFNDRVVTACVALIRPGQPTDVRSHLIAVDVEIPQQAIDVHGITTEHARAHGKPAGEVLNAVAADLADAMLAGIAVVGSNLAYDFSLLSAELARNGLVSLEDRIGGPIAPVLDVLVLDRAVDRYRPGKRKLEALAAHYRVRMDGAHDSTADALAAARILWTIGQRAHMPTAKLAELYADRRYPRRVAESFQRLAGMSLAELHTAQVGWYAEQAEGLAAYWRKQAAEAEHNAERTEDPGERDTLLADAEELRTRADSVSTEWPVRALPEQVSA